MVRSPRIEPPPSGVQAWLLTIASRFHRPHSTEDEIPRLMVKSLSTAKIIPKESHTYTEEERVEKKKKEKRVKREESNQANTQTPKWI